MPAAWGGGLSWLCAAHSLPRRGSLRAGPRPGHGPVDVDHMCTLGHVARPPARPPDRAGGRNTTALFMRAWLVVMQA